MMDELDMQWWQHDGLAQDVYLYLREKECLLPEYLCSSPHIGMRRYLVDWLAIISQMHDLSSRSQHLAILLLDFFMDQWNQQTATTSSLKHVGLCCLVLAGINTI